MTNNSPVNLKLIHFLLWIKESYQTPNAEISKCSGENFPNDSCHFWKQKSVFLQILHQYSAPSNITPQHFFNPNIIYFDQKQSIKVQIFEIFKCPDQNSSNSSCQLWTDKSIPLQFSYHSSLSYNSPVNFKLINSQLCIKESHQSPNLETLKCSGETLPISSSYFPNHKSDFLQILHQFLVSWKITPLYIFRSNITRRDQSKCNFFRLLSPWIKIDQILVVFKITNQFSFNFFINLEYHQTKFLCTL